MTILKPITPNWPAPANIQAYSTVRFGGYSLSPFDSFNLATHVGDAFENVQKNRLHLQHLLQLPNEPIWMEQIHSTLVLEAIDENRFKQGDASFTFEKNKVCAVLTADCLPLLACDSEGQWVAAIHAGWRGLHSGIIQKLFLHLVDLGANIEKAFVWLGPAISPSCYEVDSAFRETFVQQDPFFETAFLPQENYKWSANLYEIATIQLKKLNIHAIYGGEFCTYLQKEQFFSYRRDGSKTGRFATLIWMDPAVPARSRG